MWLFEKPLDEVTAADLQALVDSGFDKDEEGAQIDFKLSLPGKSEADKHEFRADVASFANAIGGMLIYGVEETGGKATALVGLDIADTEAEILRLEQTLLAGIQPRVFPVSAGVSRYIRAIKLRSAPAADRVALVIRIPRSWTGPHALVREDWLRFPARGSKGKYFLDVGQVRAAIIGAESAVERVRAFRADRLMQIQANETPVELTAGAPRMALHAVPLGAFQPGVTYDVAALAPDQAAWQFLAPLGRRGHTSRINFDGFLTYGGDGKAGAATSYLQVFRNGTVEAVDADSLSPHSGSTLIPSALFEKSLIDGLRNILQLQAHLGVEPPVALMLTLMGVRGYTLAVPSGWRFAAQERIERDVLTVPELLCERFDVDAAQTLKPAIDAVWNACGHRESLNYHGGKWTIQ